MQEKLIWRDMNLICTRINPTVSTAAPERWKWNDQQAAGKLVTALIGVVSKWIFGEILPCFPELSARIYCNKCWWNIVQFGTSCSGPLECSSALTQRGFNSQRTRLGRQRVQRLEQDGQVSEGKGGEQRVNNTESTAIANNKAMYRSYPLHINCLRP